MTCHKQTYKYMESKIESVVKRVILPPSCWPEGNNLFIPFYTFNLLNTFFTTEQHNHKADWLEEVGDVVEKVE